MLDIASHGGILEPHLLPPDEALDWTADLENVPLSHGNIFSYNGTPWKCL